MEIIPNLLFVTLLLATTWYHVNAFPTRWHSPLILWNRHVRVGAKTLRVEAGQDLRITCDGKDAEATFDPYLGWYGPDRHLIDQEGQANRLRIERSFSLKFLRLHFDAVSRDDSGMYVCMGWSSTEHEWKVAYFYLLVVDAVITTTPDQTAETRTTLETTETTVPLTTEIEQTAPPTLQATQTTVPSITDVKQTTEPISQTTNETEILNLEQTTAPEDNCTTPRFSCGSGECFDSHYRCDGFPDCADGSDEYSCVGIVCTEGTVACADGSACIPSELQCNGAQDCLDGSDESHNICSWIP